MKNGVLAFAVAPLLLLGSFCPPGSCSDAAGGRKSAWIQRLTSEDERERREARVSLVADREKTIASLLSIVSKPVTEREPFLLSNTPRNMAMSLLGRLRAKEAVPDLVSWLEPRKGQSFVVFEEPALSPAGYALVEIGLPSVTPVLEIIRQKGCSSPDTRKRIVEGTRIRFEPQKLEKYSPLGDEALRIIAWIKGVEETGFTLRKAIEAETDATTKENLQSALTLLNHPTSRGRFIRK